MGVLEPWLKCHDDNSLFVMDDCGVEQEWIVGLVNVSLAEITYLNRKLTSKSIQRDYTGSRGNISRVSSSPCFFLTARVWARLVTLSIDNLPTWVSSVLLHLMTIGVGISKWKRFEIIRGGEVILFPGIRIRSICVSLRGRGPEAWSRVSRTWRVLLFDHSVYGWRISQYSRESYANKSYKVQKRTIRVPR